MIGNLIRYLYNINVDNIRKRDEAYYFYYQDRIYIFKDYQNNPNQLQDIIHFTEKIGFFHSIVVNRDRKLISTYNGHNYILMRVNFWTNRYIISDDILKFRDINLFYERKSNFSWIKRWINKIEQVYFYLQDKTNDFAIEDLAYFNYFLNLAEVAILFFNNYVKEEYIPITIAHQRINCLNDLYAFYSLDNLILDNYNRDLGGYIKSFIYSNREIDYDVLQRIKSSGPVDDLLIVRILFPSYFFDIFDEYVINRETKDNLKMLGNIDVYDKKLRAVIDFLTKEKEFNQLL